MADQQAVADEHFQIRQVSVLIISRLTVSDITLSFSVPVVLSGTGAIPPATAVNYIPWALIGFIFNFVIRKRAFNWWAKYNYVLSAALDSGTAIGTLIVFFALQYPRGGTIGESTIGSWWGNTVYTQTADQKALPLRTVAAGNFFGPRSW